MWRTKLLGQGKKVTGIIAGIAEAGVIALLLCILLTADAQAASLWSLGEATGGDSAVRKLYEDCRQAARTIDQNEKIERVNELIALNDGDRSEDVDYAITWLTAARAASLRGAPRLQALEQGLARHSERAGLSERIAAIVAAMELSKAELAKGETDRRELLEKVAAENAGASSPGRRFVLVAALNALAKAAEDKTAKRGYYDRALAVYAPGDIGDEEAPEVVRALAGRADATDNAEKGALAEDIIARFDAVPDERVQVWVAWSRRLLAVGETGEKRLEMCLELVRKHKKHANPFIREKMAEVIDRGLATARNSPERRKFQDSLLNELRGSPSEGLTALILADQAGQMEDREEAVAAYRGIVEQFKSDITPQVRKCVVDAARQVIRRSVDKLATVAMGEEVIKANAESAHKDVQREMNGLMLACAEATVDKARKIALYDMVLDRYRRGIYGISDYELSRALYNRSAATNTPSLPAEFFAEWIASAKSEDELFRALETKSQCSYFDSVKEEGIRELVARFTNTNDAGKALVVMNTLKNNAPPGECRDGPSPVYAAMAENFSGAKDSNGFRAYLTALMSQARTSVDIGEGIVLCDRIMDAIRAREDDKHVYRELEEALILKCSLIGDSSPLARHYAAKAASADSPGNRAKLLLSQAGRETDAAVRRALYNEILDTYSDEPRCANMVISATFRLAYEASDREEAATRFRTVVDGMRSSGKTGIRELSGAYEALVELAPNRAAALALLDEMIEAYREEGELTLAEKATKEKASRVDSDRQRAELYDSAIAMKTQKVQLLFANQMLLAKALCLDDNSGKVAVYDRIIESVPLDSTPPYFEQWFVVDAVAGKAEAAGDEAILTTYLDAVLAREVDPEVDARLAINYVNLAADVAERISGARLRGEAFGRILKRYSENPSFVMEKPLNRIRDELAFSRGARTTNRRPANRPSWLGGWNLEDERNPDECQRARDPGFRSLMARVNREADVEGKVRVVDEAVRNAAYWDRGSDLAFWALFLKAELVPGDEEKRQVLDDVIERAVRRVGEARWDQIYKAVAVRTGRIEEPSERMKHFDSVIEKCSGLWYANSTYLIPLYHGRAECIVDREERIAELKRIILYFGKRGADHYLLAEIRRTLAELEAESVSPAEEAGASGGERKG